MIKTVKVNKKFWLNSVGILVQREIAGAPYVILELTEEVEIEKERVAFIQASGSQCDENISHYMAKAKEMGIKKFSYFNWALDTEIKLKNIEDWKYPERYEGGSDLDFLDNLPEEIEPVVFMNENASNASLRRCSKLGVLVYIYDIFEKERTNR